jgi:ATP-dependent Clp protease protease subunit
MAAALVALLLGWSPRMGPPSLGARSGRVAGPVARVAGAGSGGMIDGMRIGPPPDMPSMLLHNRIVYLGSPINSQVSELIVGQLLFLQYDSTEKPITMYINSPGTTMEDGRPVGFETEAFAIADTMAYIKPQINTMLVGKAYGLAALLLASGELLIRLGRPGAARGPIGPRGASDTARPTKDKPGQTTTRPRLDS